MVAIQDRQAITIERAKAVPKEFRASAKAGKEDAAKATAMAMRDAEAWNMLRALSKII